MIRRRVAPAIATAVVLSIVLGPHPVRASDAASARISAAIARQTPIADSARSVAVARGVAVAQGGRPRPPRAVRCALGLTVLPLFGAFIGLLAGGTGALATGNFGENAEGVVTGATVVGAALGLAGGIAVCVK